MQHRKLGFTDLSVSVIGLGCMSLGHDHTSNTRIIHAALDHGVNFIDTADLYDKGFNEESVGKALKGRRKGVILATKVGNQWRPDGSGWDWNPRKEYILKAVHDSLRRLQTDFIDLYQLHGGTLDDPMDETIEAFETLKQQGHIRHYGISSIRPNVIRAWTEKSNMQSVMTQYSLLDRRPEEETLNHLHDHNRSVVVRGAVAKGLLAGKPEKEYLGFSAQEVAAVQFGLERLKGGNTMGQLALRYAMQHPAVATIAAGASSVEQVVENAQAGSLPLLSLEEYVELQSLVTPNQYEKHR